LWLSVEIIFMQLRCAINYKINDILNDNTINQVRFIIGRQFYLTRYSNLSRNASGVI